MQKKKAVSKSATGVPGKYKPIVLKNTRGEDMEQSDYFFSDGSEKEAKRIEETGYLAPTFFNDVCGLPVADEELLEAFNQIFAPKDNFLFYKCMGKEVYVVIVPLKFADIGLETGALSGDHQKHAASFIMEGSVNIDTLKMKLKKMAGTMKYEKNRD